MSRKPFTCPICNKNIWLKKGFETKEKIEIEVRCHSISFTFDIFKQDTLISFNADDEYYSKINQLMQAFYNSEYSKKDVYLIFFDYELLTEDFADLLNKKFGKVKGD